MGPRPGASTSVQAGHAAIGATARTPSARVRPSAGLVLVTATGRAAGVSVSGGFDAGMTYTGGTYGGTSVIWPTGIGWTAGPVATIRANIQNLNNTAGNGVSDTVHVRHRPTAGAEYPIGTYLDLLNKAHLTFEFGGTEVSTSPWGHVGGAIISTTVSSGPSSRQQVFSSGTHIAAGLANDVALFDDIRWHAGTLKGSGVNLASSTAASQASESQHGIGAYGGTDGLIDHMIFTDFMGDGIYLSESGGTAFASQSAISGLNCQRWEMRYTQFLKSGRQGIAPGQGADDVNVHHCYFADPAYCYIDTEGNRTYQVNSNHQYDDNVFAGKWCWSTTGGPEGLGFAAPAIFLTNASGAGHLDGYFRFRRNLITGIENSPNYASTVRQILVTPPWNTFELTGEVTVEDNVKTSAERPGPIMSLRARGTGPFIVRRNLNMHTGVGSWLDDLNSTLVPVMSGNT
jgi:hypothetical protein